MKVFVITKNYQQYKDFISNWKLDNSVFVYTSNVNMLRGQRGFLYVEVGQLPDNYHEIYINFILPSEAIKINLEQPKGE